jgi:ubiquinone/menaquinone biosynthesis C-methylase UbiE
MSEVVRRDYDRLASVYEERWSHYVRATLRASLEPMQLSGHERVLVLACGTGVLEEALLARYPDLQIVGADLSLGMLQRARQKGLPSASVRWVQADARHLPLGDSRFDLVFCSNSFHYFREPEQSLGEIFRVLRPGGRFLLVDWCDDYLSCRLCSAWLRLTDPPFHRSYTVASCRELLEGCGFEIDSIDRFRISWIWGLMRLFAHRN